MRGKDTVKTPSSIVASMDSAYDQKHKKTAVVDVINEAAYMTQTSAFVTHRDVGWECKGPDEGASPSLSQNVTIILAKERSYLARDR